MPYYRCPYECNPVAREGLREKRCGALRGFVYFGAAYVQELNEMDRLSGLRDTDVHHEYSLTTRTIGISLWNQSASAPIPIRQFTFQIETCCYSGFISSYRKNFRQLEGLGFSQSGDPGS